MTSSRRVRPSTPARGRCCARAPPPSTFSCLHGLWTAAGCPYSPAALELLLQQWFTMADVVIYTRAYCSYCDWAKELLTRKGIAFSGNDVSGNREQRGAKVWRGDGGR